MAQIEIKIKPDGTIKAETFGVKGKKCMDYLKLIEQITNAKIYDSDYTADYFEEKNIVNNNSANTLVEDM